MTIKTVKPAGFTALNNEWKFHSAPYGGKAAQMYVYDCDDNGDADVLSSNPHALGVLPIDGESTYVN